MVKFSLKLIISITLLGLFLLSTQLPKIGHDIPQSKYDSLPDADLVELARENWEAGRREAAIALLKYQIEVGENDIREKIDSGMGNDITMARKQHQTYLDILANEETLSGRLIKVGKGAVTGRVNSWEELSGSTVADMFVVGDIRDLVVQSFADDPDEFVRILSGVGLASTLWPPADSAISIVKTAKKVGALSEPVVRVIIKVAKTATGTVSIGAKTAFKAVLLPILELARKCRSWNQFVLILQQCRSLDQIKALVKVLEISPNAALKLEKIFAGLPKAAEHASEVLEYLYNGGQKGMDKLYEALRKGPRGLQLVAKYPSISAWTVKGGWKTGRWGWVEVQDFYLTKRIKYGSYANIVVSLIGALALTLSVITFFPVTKIRELFTSINRKPDGSSLKHFGVFVVVVFISWVSFMVFAKGGVMYQPNPQNLPSENYEQIAVSSGLPKPFNGGFSLLGLMFAGLVQLGIWQMVNREIQKVREMHQTKEIRSAICLEYLNAAEMYADLPLYAGLAMTIIGFLILEYFPSGGRMVAYASTVIGIICAAFLRIRYINPLRNELISAIDKQDKVP